MAAAATGRSKVDGARRRLVRRFVAVLVFVWLTYAVDASAVMVPAASWRRPAVALLSAAGVAMLGWVAVSWAGYVRFTAASYLGLASDTDLPRSGEQLRGLMRAETMARYGQAVVPHLARRRRVARAGPTVIASFVLASFVYANFSPDSDPPLIAGVILVASGALATRVIRRETELALRAMEQALGGHTLTASSIRWQPDDYVAWCQAHSVKPYPHGRATPVR